MIQTLATRLSWLFKTITINVPFNLGKDERKFLKLSFSLYNENLKGRRNSLKNSKNWNLKGSFTKLSDN